MNLSGEMLGTCLSNNQLHLILFSTEACNLRCVYCYEKHRHGRMKKPVVRGIKNLLNRRAADLDYLTISWFGGEPLLARDIIEDVHGHVHSLRDEHGRMHFSAEMTTNAYLLSRAVFEKLLKLGVTGYQISFDGPREWHDRKRVLPDGRGTFDRLWQNVTALRKVRGEFEVTLRVHVDEDNVEAIPDFIAQCGRTFGGDARFQLFIRALSRLGGPNDDRLCTLEGGMEDERLKKLEQMASAQGLGHSFMDEQLTPCYAARANAFVVRGDGRINKCTAAPELPGNQVGRLNEDGMMQLNSPRLRTWMRGLSSEDAEALRCPGIGFQDPCTE